MDAIHRFLRRFATAKSPPVPYFAEYVLDAAELPPHSISFDKYPGLLLYYFVRPGRSPVRIATYWATREHFLRDGESFQAQIGAAPASLDGYVDELTIPPEPLWKRVQWYTVVLGIAAFLGALQAIGNYFDWIFSAPHLELKSDKARTNLIQGAEFQDTWSLVNQLPVAHRKIVLSASLKSDSGREQKLNIAPSFVPHMPGSSPQEVTVSGLAPAPGSYHLVVNATATAGWIRPARAFHFERPVTVWPKIPIGALSVKSVQRDTALLSGWIDVGPAASNGLECELEIKGIPALKYEELFFSMLSEPARWRTAETSGSEVASLRWAVLSVTGYERLHLKIALRGTSQTDWDKVVQRSTIRCQYGKEKIRNVQ